MQHRVVKHRQFAVAQNARALVDVEMRDVVAGMPEDMRAFEIARRELRLAMVQNPTFFLPKLNNLRIGPPKLTANAAGPATPRYNEYAEKGSCGTSELPLRNPKNRET